MRRIFDKNPAMTLRKILLPLLSLLLIIACKSNQDTGMYGTSIDETLEVHSPDDLLSLLEEGDSIPVVVSGEVTGVCQSEGCWMTFVSSGGEKIYVNVKDEAFHLPNNIKGKTATAQGVLLSVERQQQQARDRGWLEQQVSKISNISVEATGVVIE